MDRAEAISVLREIASLCDIRVNFVSLIPPRCDDVLSKGYQLHIKSRIAAEERKLIKKILDKHQLVLKEVDENIIIYRSRL